MFRRIFVLVAVLLAVTANVTAQQDFNVGAVDDDIRMLSKLLARVETGVASTTEMVEVQKLALRVSAQFAEQSWGRYDLAGCGSDSANWVKNEISDLDPADPQVASKFEVISDLYWSDPQNRWRSPDGRSNTGWSNKGLTYFPLHSFERVYWELMWSGVVKFTDTQTQKFYAVLLDAARALQNGTYYLYGPCGIYNGGVNYDDSCGEDLEGFSKFATGLLLYPSVVEQLGGRDVVEGLARKFHEQWLSADYSHGGGLVVTENGDVCQPNHGSMCNVVYADIGLAGAGNAADVYRILGENLPEWYRNENAFKLWQSTAKHILPDGSAFADDCLLNNGQVIECNDPNVSKYVPAMVPGWRFIQSIWGDDAVAESLRALNCDASLIGSVPGSNFDIDRLNQNCTWNPPHIDFKLLSVSSQPSYIDIKWLTPDSFNNVLYDVWGPNGRVAQGIDGNDYTFANIQCGQPMSFSVLSVSKRGRFVGWDSGSSQLDCSSHLVRKHLRGIRP